MTETSPLDDLQYLFLDTFAQGGELAIDNLAVLPL
jgi:hypothetical protein